MRLRSWKTEDTRSMKVSHFEQEDAEAFFGAMNEMYPYGKISVPRKGGGIDYVALSDLNKRLGYFVPDDGYYLIVRE